jgi:hypothetical protein
LEGVLPYWCGARKMMRKLSIKVKRRQKLKINMKKFVSKKKYEKKLIIIRKDLI